MAGLTKQKKYDWKDSNLSLFGSDLEKDIKKKSAETEKAWAPVNAKEKPELFIWRIVKFVPVPWPKEDYGKFYTGDSYIILNKYKKEGEDDFEFDAHFWIGSHSSQDEYGTAAYKTVELDTYLDDKAIQHREVQGHESDLFKSYFEELTFMEGGADSGFRHVVPEQYKARLIMIQESKGKVVAKEVPFSRKSLNSDDIFVIDFGKQLHQFNGKTCNMKEKMKAMKYVQKLRDEHNAKLNTIDEGSADFRDINDFNELLPDEVILDEPEPEGAPECKILYQVSDAMGDLKITKIAEGNLNKSMLKHEDVFFIDTGIELVVWLGKKASTQEVKCGMVYGHNFLKDKPNPIRPIRQVRDGREDRDFYKILM